MFLPALLTIRSSSPQKNTYFRRRSTLQLGPLSSPPCDHRATRYIIQIITSSPVKFESNPHFDGTVLLDYGQHITFSSRCDWHTKVEIWSDDGGGGRFVWHQYNLFRTFSKYWTPNSAANQLGANVEMMDLSKYQSAWERHTQEKAIHGQHEELVVLPEV